MAMRWSATLRQLKSGRKSLQATPAYGIFHHVPGALDGKHIRIQCHANGGSKFYNYKGYHSIVLLALVDANYRFTWVQVGAQGAASDAQLWNESTLRDAVITNSINIPQQEPMPGDDRPVPYFIIADNVFAINEWMIKPFAAGPLEQDERVFNHRLYRARRCVENWPIAVAANSRPFDKSRRM